MVKRRTLAVSEPTSVSVAPKGILDVITSHYEAMPPGLRAVADYILNNPSTFFFLPVQELAAKAGVSHATVIRFCKTLGYKGFYEFSRDVQQVVQAEFSLINRLNLTANRDALPQDTSVLGSILDAEINALAAVAGRLDAQDIADAAALLAEADQVFVLGLMASVPLAVHLEQMLGKVADNIHLVPSWSLQATSMLGRITDRSVLTAFAFPRYPRATVDFTTLARDKGCRVIAITNSQLSPLAKLADRLLCTPVSMLSYVDLYAAPLAVATALAVEFSRLQADRTAEKIRNFDDVVSRQRLFIS